MKQSKQSVGVDHWISFAWHQMLNTRHLVTALGAFEVAGGNGNALDVEFLLDAEEVTADVSAAKRLVTANALFEHEDRVAHFGARALIGDDDANATIIVSNDADVGTGGTFAGDARRDDDVRILDSDRDLLGNQRGRVSVALKLEGRRTSFEDRFQERVRGCHSHSGRIGGSRSRGKGRSANGESEDGKSLEKHVCVEKRYLKVDWGYNGEEN